MYKPSCPSCHARKIVKYGHPRWKCLKCQHTFRIRKKDRRDRAAIAGYTLDRSTYRRLGERWHVDHTTAMRRVKRALLKRRTLLSRTKQHLAACDGICLSDGKQIRVNGVLHTLFVAWDRGLGKPIHFQLKEEGEKELWYWKMMTELKHVGYVPKGFVSDGLPTIKEYIAEAFPNIPHQRCTVHVFLAARGKVSGKGKKPKRKNERKEEFIELMKRILWSGSLPVARKRFEELWTVSHLTQVERIALQQIWSALPDCFVCRNPKWKHLKLPRSSNAIENVMGQVEARLKTRRGTKSLSSARLLINELLLQVSRQAINQ